MAPTVFALMVTALVAVAVEAAVEPSTLLRGGLRAFADDPECTSHRARSCSGCKDQVRCDKVGRVWFHLGTVTCGGDTPYCDPQSGTCTGDVTLVDDECTGPEPVNTFNCPSDGYWPDVADCGKYYICSGGNAYAYDCSVFGANTVYSHKTSSCVYEESSESCVLLDCDSAGSYVPFPPDRSIYAFCRSTNISEAAVLKCDEGMVFNTATKECEVACTQPGRIAQADKKKYYECVTLEGGKSSRPTPGRCPGSAEFNPSLGRCAEKEA